MNMNTLIYTALDAGTAIDAETTKQAMYHNFLEHKASGRKTMWEMYEALGARFALSYSEAIDALVAEGKLKKNKAGAVSLAS